MDDVPGLGLALVPLALGRRVTRLEDRLARLGSVLGAVGHGVCTPPKPKNGMEKRKRVSEGITREGADRRWQSY